MRELKLIVSLRVDTDDDSVFEQVEGHIDSFFYSELPSFANHLTVDGIGVEVADYESK